ncbi:MAG: hypothetical protein AABZ74_18850 [Cyanobacteriota bacterium]
MENLYGGEKAYFCNDDKNIVTINTFGEINLINLKNNNCIKLFEHENKEYFNSFKNSWRSYNDIVLSNKGNFLFNQKPFIIINLNNHTNFSNIIHVNKNTHIIDSNNEFIINNCNFIELSKNINIFYKISRNYQSIKHIDVNNEFNKIVFIGSTFDYDELVLMDLEKIEVIEKRSINSSTYDLEAEYCYNSRCFFNPFNENEVFFLNPDSNDLKLYNFKTKEIIETFIREKIKFIEISNSKKYFITRNNECDIIKIWDIKEKKLLYKIEVNHKKIVDEYVDLISFSSMSNDDSKIVLSIDFGYGGGILVYDIKGNLIREY